MKMHKPRVNSKLNDPTATIGKSNIPKYLLQEAVEAKEKRNAKERRRRIASQRRDNLIAEPF